MIRDALPAGRVWVVDSAIRSGCGSRMRSRIRGRWSLVFRLRWRMINVMVVPIVALCRK
jgi:hypothetical protein